MPSSSPVLVIGPSKTAGPEQLGLACLVRWRSGAGSGILDGPAMPDSNFLLFLIVFLSTGWSFFSPKKRLVFLFLLI
jgi:hypothetical protein